MNDIEFNDVTASSLGLHIEYFPEYNAGHRIIESVSIPGRNGELTIDTGAFSDYTQNYDVMLKSSTLAASLKAIRQWLNLAGYQRLEDTYDSTVYRLARVLNSVEFSSHLNKYGRATLSFDCRPERFLKSGESWTAITSSPQTITNLGTMPSKPTIWIHTSGTGTAGTITINGKTITILAGYGGDMTIDSDSQTIYSGDTNKAAYVQMDEFPILNTGDNTITATGGMISSTATPVQICPNWWTL